VIDTKKLTSIIDTRISSLTAFIQMYQAFTRMKREKQEPM